MKILLAPAMVVLMTLLAFPAEAEDRSPSPMFDDHQSQLQPFDVLEAKRFLEQLYRKGMEVLEDHLEVLGNVQPDRDGERRGHLTLKLYPKGKSQSDEGFKAETWFGFSNKPDEDHLHFDFKFSKDRKPPFSLQDYI